MYSALEIAKYIINKCTKDKCPVSNLQLQRISAAGNQSFSGGNRGVAVWAGGPGGVQTILWVWSNANQDAV